MAEIEKNRVPVGTVDEYGSIWSGDAGASEIVGDLVALDDETYSVELDADWLEAVLHAGP